MPDTIRLVSLTFEIHETRGEGRCATLTLPHGAVETPVFMPVGTQGTVKAVPQQLLEELDVRILLGNTYHLYLRPGHEAIRRMGGLHRFMSWERPILTDSGGFQVFSLSDLRKVTEEGVAFRSHIDGSSHFFSPEHSMDVQIALGSDIAMAFDECTEYPADYGRARASLDLTLRWARRSKEHFEREKWRVPWGGRAQSSELRAQEERSAIGDQRSEPRAQSSELRAQEERSAIGDQRSEERAQGAGRWAQEEPSADGGQRLEPRAQSSEHRAQGEQSADGGQRSEPRAQSSELRAQTQQSAVSGQRSEGQRSAFSDQRSEDPEQSFAGETPSLFGIVQGGMFADLRKECAERLVEMDFPGYAIGGLSVGEPRELTREMIATTLPLLPKDKPRYVMGVGYPDEIAEYARMGVDMMDCVLPTRAARHGLLFTSEGRVNIKNRQYAEDEGPADPQCGCLVCRRYSRAYLRHLMVAQEPMSAVLNTLHNLAFYLETMRRVRAGLAAGTP